MIKKKAKVKLDLKSKTVDEKITYGAMVEKSMTDNPNFPEAERLVKEAALATGELRDARLEAKAAQQAAETMFELQGQAEEKFNDILTRIGLYVENASDGDAAKIESAGMEFFYPGSAPPVGLLPAPKALAAVPGAKEGEVKLSFGRVKGSKSYLVEFTADAAARDNWQQAGVFTRTRLTVDSLSPGTKYWFRVAAIGTAGQGPWSDPAARIVG